MLPSPDRFLEGLAFPLRRVGQTGQPDPEAMAAVLAEAERLAAGDERLEPCALFYACARRSRAFGAASSFLVPFLARSQAHAVGLVLDAEDVALVILHARVLRQEIDFDELRAWFEQRLRTA
jgi:hypothetical protein